MNNSSFLKKGAGGIRKSFDSYEYADDQDMSKEDNMNNSNNSINNNLNSSTNNGTESLTTSTGSNNSSSSGSNDQNTTTTTTTTTSTSSTNLTLTGEPPANCNNNNNNNNNSNFTNSPRGSLNGSLGSTPTLNTSSSVSGSEDKDNYYSMAKIYLNNKPNYTIHNIGRVNFNMKSEDLDQSWFHKEATRDVSLALLNSKPIGSFLIRPSSQAGSYAMSWVKSNGDVGHNLIYGLCPGYSLKQNPTSTTDRYWSLQSLVEGCDYLGHPVAVSSSTASITKSSNAKTNSEVVGRIIERLVKNDPCLVELQWALLIIGESANENVNRCEKRTFVKYCDEEYNAPEIIPLNGNSLSLIAQSLHNNTHTQSLHINGYEGYLRMSFHQNIGDTEASAIASMLLKNKSLTILNLSVNEITDNGAKAIALALKSNKTLKYLSLSHNFIGKEGLVSLSEAIRVNRSLDFVDVSNQLYKSKNLINLVHSNTERTLIALLEDTLKRKCELLGISHPINDMTPQGLPPQISTNTNIHNVSLQKLPYFHGFLTRDQAEKRLLCVGGIGSFLFYLNHYIPNSIFLAYTVKVQGPATYDRSQQQQADPSKSIQVIHKMIHRVHFGYRFVNGGLNTTNSPTSTNDNTERDEMLEEELLYNFQINNRNNENTITHTNSYNYAYRYRPRRKGCGIVIPTLFEFCSWVLASSSQYKEISEELNRISDTIGDRFTDIHDLVPLWGARDVHPVVSTLANTKTISRKGVYSTLSQLYKFNKTKLVNPVTRDQYKALKARLKEKVKKQQEQQQL